VTVDSDPVQHERPLDWSHSDVGTSADSGCGPLGELYLEMAAELRGAPAWRFLLFLMIFFASLYLPLQVSKSTFSIWNRKSKGVNFPDSNFSSLASLRQDFFSDIISKRESPRIAFVVLGMHRSGTSMFTHLLSASGYALPKDLMKATKSNKKGYFESSAIVDYNNKIMREAFEMSWSSPACGSSADKIKNVSSALKQYRDGAIQLIQTQYQEKEKIVLKDPRISLLYDFWSDILRACNYEPIPIIIVRQPLEVSASLAKRDNLSGDLSLAMWLHYTLAAERSTRAGPRAFVLHADLMADWRKQLSRLEAELGIPLLNRSSATSAAADARESVVSPELLSVRSGGAAGPLPPSLQAAYHWFAHAAASPAAPPAAPSPSRAPAAAIDDVWARACVQAPDVPRAATKPPVRGGAHK
jgi:hypothetical protein